MTDFSKRDLMYSLTEEETQKLTSYCVTIRTRDAALMLTMLYCGLRNSEARKLRIADIATFEKIHHTLIVRAEIAKNKKPREVPVPAIVRNAFRDLVDGMNRYSWSDFQRDYAFPSRKQGNELTARQVQRIVSTHTTKALGRKINPHALRHTYATRLLQYTDVRTVQYCLGHEDLRSTEIYTHPNMHSAALASERTCPVMRAPDPAPHEGRKQTLATRSRRIQDLLPTFAKP